jgi:superfamily II DNA/RNA helicase
MMTKNEESCRHILSLVQDLEFQKETAQVQAKALLSEVTKQIPSYNWSYIARRIIRNIVMATFELENISRENPDKIEDLSGAARKFALIWESLAQLREATSRKTALINAAVNYELAGYQANAMGIAKQLSPNGTQVESPLLIEMSALFLQRRFLRLLELSKKAQAEPFVEKELNIFLIEAMALALASKAFSHVVQFFLAEDRPALEKAIEEFRNAENLFVSLDLVEESNLVRSIRSLLPVMKKRATWILLPGLAPNQPRWQRYLKLLARGVGADIYRTRSISELWPSQITALEKGLLTSSSNKIVRMPTSTGKTRIAELAIVHTLVNNPGTKCVYVAPYRALVSEVEQSFLGLLSDLGYRVSTIIGSYESSDFEEFLFRETDVLVVTPEKLDLLLRAHSEFLNTVRLFIFDEGYILHDRHRGVKCELLLTRLKRKLPDARFILLSAVVPQETLEDFAAWFNVSPQEDILTSTWRPSIQRYAKFEWARQSGVLRYAPEEDIPILEEFVPGVIHQELFEYKNPETGRIHRKKFPDQINKAQVAAELAFKFAELGPVLVFCSQANHVEAVARALQERLRLSSLTNQDIPSYFAGAIEERSSVLAQEWLGDRPIASWLKSGIGVHYGDLPDVIRNAVETDFRQRKLRVLIATNTLAQGVNFPVKTVIIHSCWRYVDDSRERIPARDYCLSDLRVLPNSYLVWYPCAVSGMKIDLP